MKLEGKVALVTGAGRGIGRAIVLALAREGADIIVNDIRLELAQETAAEVAKVGRKSLALQADASKLSQVETMVDRALAEFGKIDILVNNAGWFGMKPFLENTEDYWRMVIDVNLITTIVCSRAVLPHMAERRSGKVINIASDAGKVGSGGLAVYAAAKAGVMGLTKSLAREMAPYAINVNAIAPGLVETTLLDDMVATSPRRVEAIRSQTPFRRFGTPEDVANLALFLASDDASYITGQSYSVNGGVTMI